MSLKQVINGASIVIRVSISTNYFADLGGIANMISVSGQGIINRPADTVAGLPECVDQCAQNPSCKVALILPQARNNCVLYTTYSPPRAGAGNHFAIKQ